MGVIKCTSVGLFNSISKDSLYAVSRETKDFFFIVNDNNLRSRYGKKYFEKVEEADKTEKVSVTKPEDILVHNDGEYFILTHPKKVLKIILIKDLLNLISGSTTNLGEFTLNINLEPLVKKIGEVAKESSQKGFILDSLVPVLIEELFSSVIEEYYESLKEEKTILFFNCDRYSPLDQILKSFSCKEDIICSEVAKDKILYIHFLMGFIKEEDSMPIFLDENG